MLKVWILVFYPYQGMPIEVAVYDSFGDCAEIADSLISQMQWGNAIECIQSE